MFLSRAHATPTNAPYASWVAPQINYFVSKMKVLVHNKYRMMFGRWHKTRKRIKSYGVEHKSGWDVYYSGEKLCSLTYEDEPNPGCGYQFSISWRTNPLHDLEFILNSATRKPCADVYYVNRKTKTKVEDEFFIGSIDGNSVWVRDFRSGSER